MSESGREIIRKNFPQLCADLHCSEDFLSHFVPAKVFTPLMIDEFASYVGNKKNRIFLTEIEKRGRFGFDTLYNALVWTYQYNVADILKPELAPSRNNDPPLSIEPNIPSRAGGGFQSDAVVENEVGEEGGSKLVAVAKEEVGEGDSKLVTSVENEVGEAVDSKLVAVAKEEVGEEENSKSAGVVDEVEQTSSALSGVASRTRSLGKMLFMKRNDRPIERRWTTFPSELHSRGNRSEQQLSVEAYFDSQQPPLLPDLKK